MNAFKHNGLLFLMGLLISALGSLPLGNLNVMAMSISIVNGRGPALYFALGVLLVEMFYVAATLYLSQQILKYAKGIFYFNLLAASILLGLGVFYLSHYFEDAQKMSVSILPQQQGGTFYQGVFMSAINPAQIPFWLGWNAIAWEKKILEINLQKSFIWVIGIGVGTFLGLLVFIYLGTWLIKYFNADQYLNLILGLMFLGVGCWQCFKLLRNHRRPQP